MLTATTAPLCAVGGRLLAETRQGGRVIISRTFLFLQQQQHYYYFSIKRSKRPVWR